MNLKIFLLTQDENTNYDTYDSMVVCAKNEEAARKIHPHKRNTAYETDEDLWKSSWPTWATKPENVKIRYIGIASKGS